MTYVIRNTDGSIFSFSEKADGLALSEGQRVEISPLLFSEYASRLVLAVEGISGQTIFVPAGAGPVLVEVSCAPVDLVYPAGVDLDVNGLVETVALVDGVGQIILSREVAGTFIIQPADRALYPASGSSLLVVVVEG